MLRASRSFITVANSVVLAGALSLGFVEALAGDPVPSTHVDERLPGLTAPRRIVTLAATRPGKIAALMFEEGAQVCQGDKVFLLDDRVQRARTQIAQANADSALEVDIVQSAWDLAIYHLDRYRQLDGGRNAASKEVTDAASTARSRELEYHQAEFLQQQDQRLLQLEEALLDEFVGYAPFDGFVVTHHKHVGESANELEPIVTLAQVDPLQVTVDVPLNRARSISAGQNISIEFDGIEPAIRTAVVEIISPMADAAAQTVRIKLQVANPDLALIPGSKVYVLLSDSPGTADPMQSASGGMN